MSRFCRALPTRRRLLLGAGGLLATALVRAKPGGKTYRVAWVLTTSPIADLTGPNPAHPITRAFVHELRALGYVEGRFEAVAAGPTALKGFARPVELYRIFG